MIKKFQGGTGCLPKKAVLLWSSLVAISTAEMAPSFKKSSFPFVLSWRSSEPITIFFFKLSLLKLQFKGLIFSVFLRGGFPDFSKDGLIIFHGGFIFVLDLGAGVLKLH